MGHRESFTGARNAKKRLEGLTSVNTIKQLLNRLRLITGGLKIAPERELAAHCQYPTSLAYRQVSVRLRLMGKPTFRLKTSGLLHTLTINGFTIVEMLVVLGILGTLMGFGVPLFRDEIIAKRVDTASARLFHHLSLARVESISSAWPVIICPGSKETGCQESGSWTDGWLGFVDRDKNRQYAPGEKILFVSQSIAKVDIRWRTPNWLRFNPQGEAWPNGHFKLCSTVTTRRRAVIVYLSGRVRLADHSPSGQALTC